MASFFCFQISQCWLLYNPKYLQTKGILSPTSKWMWLMMIKKPPISIFVDSTTTLDWKFYDYCTAWYYYLLFSGKGGEWTASKRCCPSQKTSQQKNQLWWWSGRRNWWTLGEGNWCFTVLLPDRTSLPLWTQRITSISFLPMIFTPEPHIKVMRIKEMITN